MMLLRSTLFFLMTTALTVLAACTPPASEQELLARARDALDQGNVRAAVIDVKTVLQQAPDSAAARRLFGEAYLFQQDFGAAIDEFERALAAGGDDEVYLLYSWALLKAGRHERLLELQRQGAFSAVGDDPRYLATLALAQVTGGDTWAAEKTIADARERAPEDPWVETAYATMLLRYRGAAEETLAVLERTVARHPTFAEAWSLLGDGQQVHGELDEAENSYAKAASLNPFRLGDRLNLVAVRIEQDKIGEATAELEQLQKIVPGHPGVNFAQGRILLQAGDYDAALAEFSQVLNVMPSHNGSLYLAATANLRAGNLATAQTQLKKLLASNPRHLQARLQLARLHLQRGEPESAEPIARAILEDDAMNVPAMTLLAAALSAQGLHAQSADIYTQVSATQPDSVEATQALGAELLQAGDLERGIAALESALDMGSDDSSQVRERLIQAHLAAGDVTAARAEAQAYRSQTPASPRPLLLLGRIALQEDDSVTAADYFRRALQLDPGNVAANSGLAAIATLEQDFAAARAHYQDALQAHPGDAMTLLSLAAIEQQQGNEAAMLDALKQAVAANARLLQPRLALARIHLQQGRSKEALALLQAVRDEFPQEPAYWQLLTGTLMETGDLAAAAKAGDRLLGLLPQDPGALALVARVQLRAGNPVLAEQHLRQAMDVQPQELDLQKLLTDALLAQGRLDEASSVLEQLPATAASEPAVQVAKARIHLAKGRPAAAEPLLRAAQKRDPGAMTLLWLSGSLWAQEKPDAALKLLLEWLEDHPGDVVVRNQLASNYLQLGREADARAQYEQVLAAVPDNVVILNNLAWLYRKVDAEQALAYIERADKLAPDNPQVKDTYAMVQHERGRHREAVRLNQRALDASPDSQEIRYHRAMILLAAGQRDEARTILETLVSAPPFATQDEARALLAQITDP